jgi:hypothetical protein
MELRVAKAMFENEPCTSGNWTWDRIIQCLRDGADGGSGAIRYWECIKTARAAIRAMREPTPEMDQAGDSEIEQQCDYSGPFVSAHKFVWKAMINAASPEEE